MATTTVDAEWYALLKAAQIPDPLVPMRGDPGYRDRELAKMIADPGYYPVLDHSIDNDQLKRHTENLRQLTERILPHQQTREGRLYLEAIKREIWWIALLGASYRGEYDRYRQFDTALHPAVRPANYWHFVSVISRSIDAVLVPTAGYVKEARYAAARLKDVWPKVPSGFGLIPNPTPREIDAVKHHILEAYGDWIPPEVLKRQHGDRLQGQAIVDLCLHILQAAGVEDWTCELVTGAKALDAHKPSKTIRVPVTRVLTDGSCTGVPLHECLHAIRASLGEKLWGLALVGAGLPGNSDAEEATVSTPQMVFGDEPFIYTGQQGHLALGFALGLDGTPRNVRELYDLLVMLIRFQSLKKPGGIKPGDETTEAKAWRLTYRTVRGAFPLGPDNRGHVSLKDAVYCNIPLWNLLRQVPEVMGYIHLGNWNILDPQHNQLMAELGALPPMLATRINHVLDPTFESSLVS